MKSFSSNTAVSVFVFTELIDFNLVCRTELRWQWFLIFLKGSQTLLFCDTKKSFSLAYLRMYSAHAHNNTINSTQATARTSAGSRRIREQWMNDSSSPEGQWTLPSHQMDALTQALSSVHECWQSSANLNRRWEWWIRKAARWIDLPIPSAMGGIRESSNHVTVYSL